VEDNLFILMINKWGYRLINNYSNGRFKYREVVYSCSNDNRYFVIYVINKLQARVIVPFKEFFIDTVSKIFYAYLYLNIIKIIIKLYYIYWSIVN